MSYSDDDFQCDYDDHYDDGEYGVANVKGGSKKAKKAAAPAPSPAKSAVSTGQVQPPQAEVGNKKTKKGKRGQQEDGAAVASAPPTGTPPVPTAAPPMVSESAVGTGHTPADKVFARISWDSEGGYFIEDYDVGYEDRFVGLRFMKAERFRNDDKMESRRSKIVEQEPSDEESYTDEEDDDIYDVYADPRANMPKESKPAKDRHFRRAPSTSSESSQSSADSFKCADKFKVKKHKALAGAGATKKPKDYAPKNVKGSDIPFHRVRCFRRISDGLIVWDRESRVDVLDQIAEEYYAKVASGEIQPGRQARVPMSTVPKPSIGHGGADQLHISYPANKPIHSVERQELNLQLNDGFRLLKHLAARPLEVHGPTDREQRLSLPMPVLDSDGQAADALLSYAMCTSAASPSTTTESLKMLTYNVLHPFHKSEQIYSTDRFALLVKVIQESAADIIALQEVTREFYQQLVGIPSPDGALPRVPAEAAEALAHLQKNFFWTALPTFEDPSAPSGRKQTAASNGVSSQIIGSRYPIIGAGTFATSKMKRHVFAIVADPLWCRSLANGQVSTANGRRIKPVPILVTAAHLVSDFAGPQAADTRTQQFEALIQSVSAPRNARAAAQLPAFRCLIGADCNFGDQSDEMNKVQAMLSTSTVVDGSSPSWWSPSASEAASQAEAAPRAPHLYHDAWLRQYALAPQTRVKTQGASSIRGSSVKPFEVLTPALVPLAATSSANAKGAKGSAVLDLTDATKAVNIQKTAASSISKLSPIGGYTYDSSINHLAALMSEKHFYPRRLDRIFYDELNFCLASERITSDNDNGKVSVALVGMEALPISSDPSISIHPSDHFGVCASLSLRSFSYVPQACAATPAAPSSAGTATATRSSKVPIPAGLDVHPNVILTKVASWDRPRTLDEDMDAHLKAWSDRQQEPEELAEVRERIVMALAKRTTQWAACAALKATKERATGTAIDLAAEDFDLDSFRSEARSKFTARLFLTGSSAMGTHTSGSDIDAFLVLPGAGRTYDEWFGELVAYLNDLMVNVSNDEDDEDEEGTQWLHSIVATPPTSKVPIIRLSCTDPDGFDLTDSTFEVEFGIAVLTGFDKVPPRSELVVATGADDTKLANEPSTMLIRKCCGSDSRSVLSFDGLRSCSSIVDRYFCCASPNEVIVPAIRYVKCWAKSRGVHGTSFGYPSGVAWAILVARLAQLYPLLTASGLVRKFFSVYGEQLATKNAAPIFLNTSLPKTSSEEDADFGVGSWSPTKAKDASALFPVLLPTPPYRNACDKVTPSTRDVLAFEMKRAAEILASLEAMPDPDLAHGIAEGLATILMPIDTLSMAAATYSAVLHVITGVHTPYSSVVDSVGWALRQNLTESSLPTIINAVDKARDVAARPIPIRFVRNDPSLRTIESTDNRTCHHFILLKGSTTTSAVSGACTSFEYQLSNKEEAKPFWITARIIPSLPIWAAEELKGAQVVADFATPAHFECPRQADIKRRAQQRSATVAASSKPTKIAQRGGAPEHYIHTGPRLKAADFQAFTRTALVFLPPQDWWPAVNTYRGAPVAGGCRDKSYPRWMPHVTLMFPFVQPHQMQEAIVAIEEQLGFARAKQSSVMAGQHGASPTVTVGESDGGHKTIARWVYDVPTVGTFDRKGGSAVVFLEPIELAEDQGPTSAEESEAQKLYAKLQPLFPRCGRCPLITNPGTRQVAGEEEGSAAFHPHLTVGRTFNQKDTDAFVNHVKTTWPACLADPTITSADKSSPTISTKWPVDAFYLIAHLEGTDQHQIIHTFKL